MLSYLMFVCLFIQNLLLSGVHSYQLTRYKRSDQPEKSYFLTGNKVERNCFKGLTDEEIENVEECDWNIGNLSYSDSELDANERNGKYPHVGQQKCSIIDEPKQSVNWTCGYMIGDESEKIHYQLFKGVEMSSPTITLNGRANTTFTENDSVVAKCIVNGPSEPPVLLILTVKSDVRQSENQVSSNKISLSKEDNGAIITCEGKQDIEGTKPKMVNTTLNVRFSPSFESSDHAVNENGKLTISFKFKANPEPSKATWQFAKKSDEDSKMDIKEEPRYVAQDIQKDDDAFVAALLVSNASNEDLSDVCFHLTIENDIGQKMFSYCPVSDDGNSVGIIVGILVGVGILLAGLIAGFILYRKKMRGSYARASTN